MKTITVLIGITLLITGGCTPSTNLTKEGRITLTNHSTGKVKILWSQANASDGQLVVSGTLKRLDRAAPPLRVHIHALEINPDKEIVQSLKSDHIYVPRRRVARGPDWKRFELRSSTLPQPDAQLRLIVHSHEETHTDQDLLSVVF